MSQPKTIVFIEGSNIYFAQKKMGKWLDWVKVKRFLNQKYKVLEYRYYVGVRPNDSGMQKFLRKLKKIGFKVITKPVKIVTDEKGNQFEKANFDVEITTDAILSRTEFDIMILFSGDSDFAYLSEIFRQFNKSMAVYSTRGTLAWELKLKAKYYFIEDIKGLTKHKRFVKL